METWRAGENEGESIRVCPVYECMVRRAGKRGTRGNMKGEKGSNVEINENVYIPK